MDNNISHNWLAIEEANTPKCFNDVFHLNSCECDSNSATAIT